MKQAILITDKIACIDELLFAVEKFSFVEKVNEFQINIILKEATFEKGIILVYADRYMEQYVEEDETSNIAMFYPSRRFYYVIDYKDFNIFQSFISKLFKQVDFIIDNDHGSLFNKQSFYKITTYEEFIGVLK